MSKVLVTQSYLEDIADAIRLKSGGIDTYTPAQMAAAIAAIPTGGGGDAFAVIIVTYIQGHVCTATNGTVTLIAPDTSGLALFAIPTPATTPETWTLTDSDGQSTVTKTVSVAEYGEVIHVRVGDTIAMLKSDMDSTLYTMLSTAVDDGATESGRWFKRTTNEPVIFLDYYSSNDTQNSYNSYAVISLSSTPPAHTNNS